MPVSERTNAAAEPGFSISADLRPACSEDREFLLALYGEGRRDELAAVPWTEEQRQEFITMQYCAREAAYKLQYPGLEHRMIMHAGETAGHLMVWRTDEEIRVVDLALAQESRGRGIGTGLLREILAEAAETGRLVRLHVDRGSRAQSLYQRLGFTVAAELDFHTRMEWRSESAGVPVREGA